MKLNLLQRARDLAPDLVALRRDLHRHPELGFQEHRTAGRVTEALEPLGLEVRTGVGRTGVVADLVIDPGGPTVVLRADMDALPIQEENEHDYRSATDGVMHACGHDAHTSALVGAARTLAPLRDAGALPAGTVRFLFQPSEERADDEGRSGAAHMIAAGALDDTDAVVGLHVGAHLPSGKLFLSEGSVMAGSEELRVDVRGESAHAAWPHKGTDALVLAAQGVLACQQAVARRISPVEGGVVTFGTIRGGRASNVLASHVALRGTLRYFRREVRDALADTVRGSFEMLERLGARVDVAVGPGYPPLVNDSDVTRTVRDALVGLTSHDDVLPMGRMMAAEDFAFMAREIPGCFFWLGAALPEPREHHSPTFDIDDSVLPLGAAALATAAAALLERGG